MLDIPRVFLALDALSAKSAGALASSVGGRARGFKIHDLLDRDHRSIAVLRECGARVWVDYKLHDIPDTVERRSRELVARGASIISCHASGGAQMLQKALASGAEVFAVTVLSSLSDADILRIYHCSRGQAVTNLALLAAEAGVQGIVCSASDVGMLRALSELRHTTLITPGIRLPGQSNDDHDQAATPEEAVRDGADYIVVGRPITLATDPVAALDAIEKSVRKGLAARAR